MELLAITSIGSIGMYAISLLYASVLISIAKTLRGGTRFLLSLLAYLAYAIVMSLPLFHLIQVYRDRIQESTLILASVLIAYAIIVAPGIYYLLVWKKDDFRKAGIFKLWK